MKKFTEKFRRAIRLENIMFQAIGKYRVAIGFYPKNKREEGEKLMKLASDLYKKTPKSMKTMKRFFKRQMNGYKYE